MNKKTNNKGIIRLAIVAILAVAFAGTSFAVSDQEKSVAYPYPYYNMPEVLVFSGVAALDDDVSTAVFIALDKQQIIDNAGPEYLLPYKTYYMIVDGEATQFKIKDISLDKETQTLIAKFVSQDGHMTLVIKQHTTNYQNVVVVSGTFGEYLLNMKLYNNEYIYTIMPALETSVRPAEKPVPGEMIVEQAIVKINKQK